NEINTDRVLYMEYFYFVLYAAILLVVIDAFLVAFESKLTLIRFRDNLLPKVLLWPVLMVVILIVTVVTYY
ncbi:MAG TPA: hypothetical protein VHY08_12235, partial [Bacillota bacterium]|nr:hypothetical protein [Bacillota bacterium]